MVSAEWLLVQVPASTAHQLARHGPVRLSHSLPWSQCDHDIAIDGLSIAAFHSAQYPGSPSR